MFLITNGDIPLASTGIDKSSIIQDLILEKLAEVQSKKKKRWIIKTWVEGALEPSTTLFPQPDFSKYQDFSAWEMFELFFDNELFEILVRKLNDKL